MKIRYCTKSTILHKIADPRDLIDFIANMTKYELCNSNTLLKITGLDLNELNTIKHVIIFNHR